MEPFDAVEGGPCVWCGRSVGYPRGGTTWCKHCGAQTARALIGEVRAISPHRRLSPHVLGIAVLAIFALFGILVATTPTEPRHVAFYDSCLLVLFPLALFVRRRR